MAAADSWHATLPCQAAQWSIQRYDSRLQLNYHSAVSTNQELVNHQELEVSRLWWSCVMRQSGYSASTCTICIHSKTIYDYVSRLRCPPHPTSSQCFSMCAVPHTHASTVTASEHLRARCSSERTQHNGRGSSCGSRSAEAAALLCTPHGSQTGRGSRCRLVTTNY